MISIRRGLDLPIGGVPDQRIEDGPEIRTVAVLGPDYHGMKPTMAVEPGDPVRKGQLLFSDKKNPGVGFTSPACGSVSAVNRGAKRVLLSVVIEVDGDESVEFPSWSAVDLASLERKQVVENLVNSGLWTSLRTRPFSRTPEPDSVPSALFVNAMDTNPLAADPALVLADREQDYLAGIDVLSRLTDGPVYVVRAAGSSVPVSSNSGVHNEEFSGIHPAGLVGTHIHFLHPVSDKKQVWTVNYQDVAAIGSLFLSGRLDARRVIALGGPSVDRPRLLRTVLGASTDELTAGELSLGSNRVVSGSVLSGRIASGPLAYLGRYHLQVSALPEGRERRFLGWLSPGLNRHSVNAIYVSHLLGRRPLEMNCSTNGSPRALVPIGSYEKVMPLDILATPLLKALLVGDLDMAVKLGALELDEEDLALCTYVCSGKYEYGPILRDNLTRIFTEG